MSKELGARRGPGPTPGFKIHRQLYPEISPHARGIPKSKRMKGPSKRPGTSNGSRSPGRSSPAVSLLLPQQGRKSRHCEGIGRSIQRNILSSWKIRHASWDRAFGLPAFLRKSGWGSCNVDQPQVFVFHRATKKVTGKIGYLAPARKERKKNGSGGWPGGMRVTITSTMNFEALRDLPEKIRAIAKEAEEVYVITKQTITGEKSRLQRPGA